MTLEEKAGTSEDLTFMVVDDDQVLVHALARALRPLGKVAFSNNFDSVHLTASSAKPRVMLIDIDLPLVTGIEIARRIRSNQEMDLVYILMMTSHRSEAVLKQVAGLDVDGLLEKPIDIPALLVRVKAFLSEPRRGPPSSGN
ncbi:response regulator [Hydrogenophaga sp. RAC07]|uniref:response regulator n=1 Tax=Hydrogenophaga sp. RAC07 TaxID=1842537 RepID=UPI00083E68A3|nr:response regulator [Hydrogenophaga sp. RAC07]AOF87267.1 response regulator [Hydrogenophaga sp. RAC07]